MIDTCDHQSATSASYFRAGYLQLVMRHIWILPFLFVSTVALGRLAHSSLLTFLLMWH